MASEIIEYLENKISEFSKLQREMDIGRQYYKLDNDILDREKWKGIPINRDGKVDAVVVKDTSRANHKMPSGFAKKTIMQKVSYSINDKLTVTQDEDIYKEVFKDWKNQLKKTGLMASQTIYEAWLPYIEDEQLKFKRIPGNQLIVDFETHAKEQEKSVIRYYKKDDVEIAELYTDENVTVFHKDEIWELVEIREHITRELTDSMGNVMSSTSESWGVIPLIILYNNDELETDVKPIKPLIDVFDIINSDFANNIDDFQEIFTVIRGYSGSRADEVLSLIKKLGGVNVDGDGDVDYKQGKIPTEARTKMLDIIRDLIYETAMAVDVKKIAAGNATNNTIAAMYEDLNMKASTFEQELQKFFRKFNVIINRYFEITGQSTRVDGELVFDRTMLVNQKEMAEQNKIEAETLVIISGLLDDETLAEIVTNMDFINKYANLTKEELMERLQRQTDAIQIE